MSDFCSTDYKSKQDIFRHCLKVCQLKNWNTMNVKVTDLEKDV